MSPSSKRRDGVFGSIRRAIDSGQIKVLPADQPLPDDTVIILSRAATFDPADNSVWTNPANWSIARDLYCRSCSEQVVMSHTMFDTYQTCGGNPGMILCIDCLNDQQAMGGKR